MVQRGYRALVLWVIWAAAAVIIYLGLYLDTEVWDFVQNDHSRITWAIIGLFGLGVAISFALTILLTLEFVKVDSLEHIAKRDGWLGIQEADKKGCVAEFFSSLRTIINNNGDLNIEALVDVEFSVYQRIAHSLEIIGNLLITLGLIGTVVGLTLTLTGLTSSLDALGHDQDQLLAGLRGAMAGMGTAFYTTLLGAVLGGVLLRIFAHIDENGVESLEDALTRICLVYCSADFKPSLERDLHLINAEIDHMSHNISGLQTLLEDTRKSMSHFATEVKQPGQEMDIDHLREMVRLREAHIKTLALEIKLKQSERGVLGYLFGDKREDKR
ncbi:MAG: MotA/TolQ/ExbB proton channel family protein [Ectothiorhodospiraceae bacterium]|nr:MotA/TolQ/ExbB proton channel family protein [Ectothiorhodospiraceae bacterium]